MALSKFARLRDWVEPAHPALIKNFQDLVVLYTAIRDRLQPQIDAAFDGVSRRIGYVVATTAPVTINVGDMGKIENCVVGGETLKGTLFDEALSKVMSELTKQPPLKGIDKGKYDIFLIWHAALKLKLRKDWMEPAHVFDRLAGEELARAGRGGTLVGPGVREPAHFFDPGMRMSIEDVVLVSALDEVYPDIHLADRVAAERLPVSARAISPEVMEPAHFRVGELFRNEEFVTELSRLLQKFAR